ncbi:hypothetical protein E6W26_19410 [Pseudomonas aeruginosa]|uniref:hypothetical protein n=1 Tax=Pseudomonas aeruginosa TaxID=287 RepID=UPI00109DE195|nr:hypothetical protein [Pseudomonas aeruginosa]EKV1239517.1 hypothetical protein [Pseudomonas aeruginosa]EKV8587811.1 hypothetical protein [Pseudomonas aeruginosa]ELN5409873.1 hypothetical protein [Pseudomonas aeruginosa]ELP1434985.1 hypothetical protein [Pseudomonas aeruginosa]THB19475.1 hypothetical protein E6W26_19410 [Pseudomonas aeruginosa]
MKTLDIKDDKLVNNLVASYINDRYKLTSESIKNELGKLPLENVTYETAIELGSIFMYQFSKTNSAEFDKFINSKQLEFTDNKISSYFNIILKRKVQVDVELESLTERTIADFDVSKKNAAKFLEEIGIPSPFINTFVKNAENLKAVGETFVLDYLYQTGKEPSQDMFKDKHIFQIFKEMNEVMKYKNMHIGFADNHKWQSHTDPLNLPQKGFITFVEKRVDIIGFRAGHELETLLRDKNFFNTIVQKHNEGYKPIDHWDSYLKACDVDKELNSYQRKKEVEESQKAIREYYRKRKSQPS